MFRSFLGGGSAKPSSASLHDFPDELAALQDAMEGASHMMNDDMEKAESELAKGNSAFHKLGLGVAGFLQAVLGFERDMMLDASNKLTAAENSAWDAHKHAQRRSMNSSGSVIYGPGSEYTLCVAEVQIMGAVVAVLTESLTESIKGFYKLRKAYLALDALVQQEQAYLKSRGFTPSTKNSAYASKTSLTTASGGTQPPVAPLKSGESSDSDDFVDAADDTASLGKTDHYEGRLSTDPPNTIHKQMDQMTINDTPDMTRLERHASVLEDGPDLDFFKGNQMDMFIHSGSNMCYGIILILLSLIPPSFSTLAKIAGFQGDRKRGVEMLWQATKFNNINGAFAGLTLLGYYNGMLGFTDIQPRTGKGAYPKERCKLLLVEMRRRYPQSRLWLLEEARTMSTEKQLKEAVHVLETVPESKLKQVLALQWFERSLNNMYLHRFEKCAEAFLKMIELNKWSHGLYYYIAGVALVEHYRDLKAAGDEVGAKDAAQRAEQNLRKVPENVGKRKIIGKQLPFDIFVSRKLIKWDQRAAERGCSFIDAIGMCPIEEMIYFWNGYKKMPLVDLEASLTRLRNWTDPSKNPTWANESLDEKAMASTQIAVVLRNMGKTTESRRVLNEEVLVHPWPSFKGGNKDNWPLPVAHYELAVNAWQEYDFGRGSKSLLDECLVELEKVATWEAFDLDTRFGVRITTGKETVKREQQAAL